MTFQAGEVVLPMWRTLPWRTRSVSASSVSSIGRLEIGPMGLVEVDMVGLEAAERVLARLKDVPPRASPVIRAGSRRIVNLGRDDGLVTASARGECPADDPLAFPLGVDVGRIDEVEARVERGPDHRRAFGFGRRIGEVVRSQAKGRNLQSRVSQALVFHRPSPPLRARQRAVYPASTVTIEPVM